MAVKAPVAKKNIVQKHKEFLLFISIPIVITLLLVAMLMLPGILAHPKHDFIYSSCPTYDCDDKYEVTSTGMVEKVNLRQPSRIDYSSLYDNDKRSSELYLYSQESNSYRRISLDEANQLRLDTSSRSSDGYQLRLAEGNSGGFLFWGSSGGSDWQLQNGFKKKTVVLSDDGYYADDLHFIGWVQ